MIEASPPSRSSQSHFCGFRQSDDRVRRQWSPGVRANGAAWDMRVIDDPLAHAADRDDAGQMSRRQDQLSGVGCSVRWMKSASSAATRGWRAAGRVDQRQAKRPLPGGSRRAKAAPAPRRTCHQTGPASPAGRSHLRWAWRSLRPLSCHAATPIPKCGGPTNLVISHEKIEANLGRRIDDRVRIVR